MRDHVDFGESNIQEEIEGTLHVLHDLAILFHEFQKHFGSSHGDYSYEKLKAEQARLRAIGIDCNTEELMTKEGVVAITKEATAYLREAMLYQIEHAFEKHPTKHHEILVAVETFYNRVSSTVDRGGKKHLKELRESAQKLRLKNNEDSVQAISARILKRDVSPLSKL